MYKMQDLHILVFLLCLLVFQCKHANGIATCNSKMSSDIRGNLTMRPPLWTLIQDHDGVICASYCMADTECTLFRFFHPVKTHFAHGTKVVFKKCRLSIQKISKKKCSVIHETHKTYGVYETTCEVKGGCTLTETVCSGGRCPYDGQYESNCSIRDRCRFRGAVCYHHKCLCKLGYFFSPSQKKCLKVCQKLGETMSIYKGAGIVGHNDRSYSGLSRDECLRKCIQETAFLCKAVDIRQGGGECLLSRDGFLDVPRRDRERGSITWELGHRNCM